jgi:hypothetical protein
MHEKPIEEGALIKGVSDEGRDSSVMGMLLFEKPTLPWTVAEVESEMREPLYTTDSISRLVRAGLLHRSGEYVWPTRTACYAAEIEIGTA